MYEVEVKVRADHERVRAALDDLDAERGERLVQADTYYDAPDRDFAETDEALRVRRERSVGKGRSPNADPPDEAATVRITYKGPLLDDESKSRREHETAVSDADEVAAILDGLGFEPAARVRKERERFAVDEYTVTLDTVDGLGEFVEVEVEIENSESVDDSEAFDDEMRTAREGVQSVLRALDLDPETGIRTSYLGLLLADNAEE